MLTKKQLEAFITDLGCGYCDMQEMCDIWSAGNGDKRETFRVSFETPFPYQGFNYQIKALAVLWQTFLVHCPNYSVVHVSRYLDKSMRLMSYMRLYAGLPLFKDQVTMQAQRRIQYTNGSSINIYTASMNGLNAMHSTSLSLDMTDGFNPNLVQEAERIPMQQIGGVYPSLIITLK
jgi:hypothetical protein